MSIGIVGYSFAALAFFAFGMLLLTSWRGRTEGAFLVSAVLVSCLWAVTSLLFQVRDDSLTSSLYLSFEILKNVAWFLFLFYLLKTLRVSGGESDQLFRYAAPAVYLLAFLLFVFEVFSGIVPHSIPWWDSPQLQLIGHLCLAVTGLALIEQLFRHTRPEKRWKMKFLYLGIGIIFVYDFFLYADALLFKQVDTSLWQARGFISVISVPLVAVAAARNPSWSVDIFVSRRVVFHTTTFIGAGVYLLFMSAAGYYIRYHGGSWGKSAQVVFLFLTLVFLATILFSGTFRSRIKIFLNKHFFNYKYDYREEWLQIIQTLSSDEGGIPVKVRVIKAIANLVDSTAGVLWLRDDRGRFVFAGQWKIGMDEITVEPDSSLIRFLKRKDWIINFKELAESPGFYDDLEMPASFDRLDNPWLLVPIRHQTDVIGFVILMQPRAPRQINWEDTDLLKTVAKQAGSYLALMQASEALSRANQFEAFNRLSAFVVHDLKNVLAQLELLVRNAERHRNNPAFMEDAIHTVDNAANKMSRLLDQLRKGRFEASERKQFLVEEAVHQAVALHTGFEPQPEVSIRKEGIRIIADRDRFTAVIGHMLKNAQEATPADGYVRIHVDRKGDCAEILVEDSGSGMSPAFIKERLFRPFETTKGNAGMGVGVYESREFIRSLGGDIEVASQVNRGTRFTLRIPIGEAARDQGMTASTQYLEPQH